MAYINTHLWQEKLLTRRSCVSNTKLIEFVSGMRSPLIRVRRI